VKDHTFYACVDSACSGCAYCVAQEFTMMGDAYMSGNRLLRSCVACHGSERSLPTECPGRPMSDREVGAVYAGTLDYRHGTWGHSA
jgi:hypothetical protein